VKKNIIIIIFIFTVFAFYVNKIRAQENTSTHLFKNTVKIDLLPYYYDFFDVRKQIRIALENERYLTLRSSVAAYCDAGLFDDYFFIKYYDFFSQGPGFYSVTQKIKIRGVHFQPSYNYYLFLSRTRPNRGIFIGGTFDIQYYRKNIKMDNSLTGENTSFNYFQARLGGGLHAGGKYNFGSHFYAEIKTCLFAKILQKVSMDEMDPLKPLNAQWSDKNYDFWWVSNIKIGYAF
jgi:hypothetical protein